MARGLTGLSMRRARVPEKIVQSQIVAALRSVGAAVYVLGRPPRADAVFKGTGQTAGIPDLYVLLPESVDGDTLPHGLWIEVKGVGGKLRPAQAQFALRCRAAAVPHLVGGLEEVLAYLVERGYVKEVAHYRAKEG